MKHSFFQVCVLFCLCIPHDCEMILRNNALMTKMVSDFHAPKTRAVDIMRNVLCKHFPSIPCKLITKDDALRNLVLKTVRLLNEKQRNLQNISTAESSEILTTEPQTRAPAPVVNSDELSQYLAVENTGYFTEKHQHKKDWHEVTPMTTWTHDADAARTRRRHSMSSHKTIKKYFPHKMKYKDKNDINESGEKISISEEIPPMDSKKLNVLGTKKQSNTLPVWQIDYTKQGDPGLPEFSQETDLLRGKLVKGGTDSDNTVFKHRTSVLRPNVFIKNSVKRVQDY